MSYARGMGSTATDIAAVAAAASTAAAQIIAAASGGGTSSTASATIDPATGMPYGAINPATGLPYGTPAAAPATDSTVPLIIGGIALAGLVGFVVMRRSRTTPNRRRRRRVRTNSAWQPSGSAKTQVAALAAAQRLADSTGEDAWVAFPPIRGSGYESGPWDYGQKLPPRSLKKYGTMQIVRPRS